MNCCRLVHVLKNILILWLLLIPQLRFALRPVLRPLADLLPGARPLYIWQTGSRQMMIVLIARLAGFSQIMI